MCWVQVIIAIVMIIVGELLKPKPKSNARPAGLGDFQFPTAEAGRVFPIIAGTVKMLGPNTVASGGFRSEESYKRVRSSMFATAKQSYGFRYYITFQQVWSGGPIDAFVGMQVDDKFLKLNVTEEDHRFIIDINDKAFYGDEMTSGGFAGKIYLYKGTAQQPADPALLAILPGQTEVSAYRYVAYAMYVDFYVGMSATPPPYVPIFSRWPNSLALEGGKHIINETASNPICFVYDLMTNPIREGAIAPGRIDRDAFLAAARTVFDEKIGVNIILDQSQSLQDAVNSIMQYVDGQVFEDPFTGKFTVKLVRADYDVDTLLELNESNARCVGRTKTSWGDTKNTVVVHYMDKTKNWTNQSVQSQDLANLIVLQGQVNLLDIDFTGADNPDLANYLAERARQAVSTPFAQLEIETQGTGASLRINEVFKGSFPSKRIQNMVLRITDIEYPNIDDPVCKIKCVEDKFGVKFVAYDQVSDHTWLPPVLVPQAPRFQLVEEVPYALSPDGTDNPYALAAVVRAGSVETGFSVYDVDTSAIVNSNDQLTSGGRLSTALPIDGPLYAASQAAGLRVNNLTDGFQVISATPGEYALGQSFVQIGNEIIGFQNVTVDSNGELILWPWSRAMFDTIPEGHATNSVVFFLSTGVGLVQETPFLALGDHHYKLPTRVGSTTMDVTALPVQTITVRSRAKRPYPPGNVKVNGTRIQLVTDATVVMTTINVTWNHRNRLQQGTALVPYDTADIGPEPGTTYVVRYYNADTNVLLLTQSGIVGNSTSATLASSVKTRIEVTSQRDLLESFFVTTGTITYQTETFRLLEPNGERLLAPNGDFLRKP